MPKAVVNSDGEKFDLKTCPGGYVSLKQMTYGQMLERRDFAAKMVFEGSKGQKDVKGALQMANVKATVFDFKNCIVDHNLEDAGGNKLDLTNQLVITTQLDPRIGEEISSLIDKLNQFSGEEEGN